MSKAPAQDPRYREAVQRQVEKLLRRTPYHSLRLPDGTVIPGLIGIEALDARLAAFPIPESLSGCRVLDVGAASGFNSFAMAARGASVVAVDCVEFEELTEVCQAISADLDYRLLDVDELSVSTVGTFDYILFFGVLYHLRHPLLALETICALTRISAFVESFVSDPIDGMSQACSMEFYETDELGGQIDNWHGPTALCLMALCRAAGFVRVKFEYVNLNSHRAGITCHRHWEPQPENPEADAVVLYSAVNNRTGDIYFHVGKDEYLCVYFRSAEKDLTREDIRVEVDGWAVNTLVLVHRKDDEWQANTRLPPGLECGEHWVTIRTAKSRFANQFRIELASSTVPHQTLSFRPPEGAAAPPPLISGVENSLDGTTTFHGYSSERLCCRFESTSPRLDRDEMSANIDGRDLQLAFLTHLGDYRWEANISPPRDLQRGEHQLRLRIRNGDWSDAVAFTLA